MKKTVVLAIFCCIFLSSCGLPERTDRISAKDFMSKETLVIMLPFRYAIGAGVYSTSFATDLTLDELCEKIVEKSDSEKTYFIHETPNENVRLIEQSDHLGKKIVFLREDVQYQSNEKRRSHTYSLMPISLCLRAQREAQALFYFLFPYYLLPEPLDFDPVVRDALYETEYSFEDFCDFYQLYLNTYPELYENIVFSEKQIILDGRFLEFSYGTRIQINNERIPLENMKIVINYREVANIRTVRFDFTYD